MKKRPFNLVVYIITTVFLIYLTYICFFAKPNQILLGNVFIKPDSIDFGGFGSLLAGIFSPLAFLWLVLNFRQQEKNLELTEELYLNQKAHQNSEYNIQIINTYIEALKHRLQNFHKDGTIFPLDDAFIKRVYSEYTRLYIVNPNSYQSTMMHSALSTFGVQFDEELPILRSIETQILEEKDDVKRRNLLTLLHASVNSNLITIMQFSATGMDFKKLGYRDYIDYLHKNGLLRPT